MIKTCTERDVLACVLLAGENLGRSVMEQIPLENSSNSSTRSMIPEAMALASLGKTKDAETFTLSKDELGTALYQLGKSYYDKSDLVKSETCFREALKCSSGPQDSFVVLKTLGFLIRICSEKLEDKNASHYIESAEVVVEELTSGLGSLNAEYFYNAGIVKNYRGLFEESRASFELAYAKSKEENEPELLSKCLLALAVNHFNRKEYEKTLGYLEQLGQLLRIIKKTYLSGAMNLFFGKTYMELGDYQTSLRYLTEANRTLQDKKCWNLYGYILLAKGTVYKLMGDYASASAVFDLAKENTDRQVFRRLTALLENEINDVNDSSVDLYLDRSNRKITERELGTIDFKHRFVLLEILFLLSKNAGIYYDKEQLAKSIWKDEYNPLIHDKLIYTSVSRLRKLIEPSADRGQRRKYIIRGKDGYTFNPLAKIRFHMEGRALKSEKAIGNVEIGSPV